MLVRRAVAECSRRRRSARSAGRLGERNLAALLKFVDPVDHDHFAEGQARCDDRLPGFDRTECNWPHVNGLIGF